MIITAYCRTVLTSPIAKLKFSADVYAPPPRVIDQTTAMSYFKARNMNMAPGWGPYFRCGVKGVDHGPNSPTCRCQFCDDTEAGGHPGKVNTMFHYPQYELMKIDMSEVVSDSQCTEQPYYHRSIK